MKKLIYQRGTNLHLGPAIEHQVTSLFMHPGEETPIHLVVQRDGQMAHGVYTKAQARELGAELLRAAEGE